MQCDFVCSCGTSPAYDRRGIPASPCTPPRCCCARSSGDDLPSSHMWACCRTDSRCDPIHSRAHIRCRQPHLWIFWLSTTLPLPWWRSWPCPLVPCSPLQQKQLMMRRFLHSGSSPWWHGGSPPTVHGWGLLRLHSSIQIPLASSAGLPYLFPCIVRGVLYRPLAFLETHFFDINVSIVNRRRCGDDNVTILWSNHRSRIWVCDCRDCARGIPSCVYDPNVYWGLLVGKRSVDCWCNFLVHLFGGWHPLVSL